jgi:predicted small secreted protein
MKKALLVSIILLASSTVQASGSTATGPLVDCSLSNGKSVYIPAMICQIEKQK